MIMMRLVKRRAPRLVILVSGILLSFFGYHIEARSPWALTIVAKRYIVARRTYRAMLNEGLVVVQNDPGYDEILDVLRHRKYQGSFEVIQSIGAHRHAKMGVTEDGLVGRSVRLVLTFTNGHTQPLIVGELDNDLAELFLNRSVTRWAKTLFYVGLCLTAIAGLSEITEDRRPGVVTHS